jgi:hypothetical protein
MRVVFRADDIAEGLVSGLDRVRADWHGMVARCLDVCDGMGAERVAQHIVGSH